MTRKRHGVETVGTEPSNRAASVALDGTPQRLQKLLAAAGYGSRRQCEELIVSGRVEVDRQVAAELGTRVDPAQQQITVDGVPVKSPRLQYFLVNKPPGVVSTARDPWARLRVIDLVDSEDRLFTVGRLDKETSGLILVTNDGALTNQLAHPRYGITKTYQATVVGKPSTEILGRLTKGIHLAEAATRADSVSVKSVHANKTVLEIVLAEGRNREIRRMLARVGHKVVRLKRIAMGPVRLGEMPLGSVRELTREEIRALRQSIRTNGSSRAVRSRSGANRMGSRSTSLKKVIRKGERNIPARGDARAIHAKGSKPRPAQGSIIGGEHQGAEKREKQQKFNPKKKRTTIGRNGSARGDPRSAGSKSGTPRRKQRATEVARRKSRKRT